MAEIKIAAETRTEFGKGAARRIRRDDKVPAVLYGDGAEPVHVTLPGHSLMMALKNSNALLTIEIEGDPVLAIPKQVQRDPIRGFIEHADLLIVKKGQKVTVDIPVHLLGDAFPGTLVVQENTSIAVEAEATNIPNYAEISIEGLKAGEQLHASDIPLPDGTELSVDADLLIVNITAAPSDAELEAELDDALAGASVDSAEPAAEGDAAEGDANAESADKE